jgi:hypothetical protein
MLNREPRITIVVPTMELAISLSNALSEIPGEQAMGAHPDLPYDVTLHDFPRTTVELERLLTLVRSWLAEVDIDSVTVESRWQIKRAKRPGETESRVLTWKLEDGPEDAPEGGSPEDVGPAWLYTYRAEELVDSEPIAGGEWITRGAARRLAKEHGYELSEDG